MNPLSLDLQRPSANLCTLWECLRWTEGSHGGESLAAALMVHLTVGIAGRGARLRVDGQVLGCLHILAGTRESYHCGGWVREKRVVVISVEYRPMLPYGLTTTDSLMSVTNSAFNSMLTSIPHGHNCAGEPRQTERTFITTSLPSVHQNDK